MPKINGFELCRQTKKIDSKVKVSFMTALDIRKGGSKGNSTIFNNNNNNNKHII
jgi:hypothetical protein